MIAKLAFLAARLVASAIFLLAWLYGVITHSSFAFEQMVKPRLFPALADFVTWHHAWFALAFVLSAATLVPLIRNRHASWLARGAAIGYVLVIGGIAFWLLGRPYLASLSGARDLVVVPGALLPLFWLAVIDHLTGVPDRLGATTSAPSSQRVLLSATACSAVLLWAAHSVAAWLTLTFETGIPPIIVGGWSIVLDLGAALVVYVALQAASVLAAGRARAGAWEYFVTLAFVAIGFEEFMRALFLPTLGFSAIDAAMIAVPFGITLALVWSGLRLRSAARDAGDGLFLLLAIPIARPALAIALIVATTVAAAIAIVQADYFNWAFIPQQLIALIEATIVLGLVLPLARRWTRDRPWSLVALAAPPAIAVLSLHALTPATTAAAARLSGNPFDPQAVLDQSMAADPLTRLSASVLIEREPFDLNFYRRLHDGDAAPWTLSPAVPAEISRERFVPAGAPPHVFVFAIDSLRRDYLSPYNPAVTFTPNIDRWAAEAHVFRNAFTTYGGTLMALPSLWAGRHVPRGWPKIFSQFNALEPMINDAGFDFLINDYTFQDYLRKDTKRTFINPYIPSVRTNLCQTLTTLQGHITRRTSTQPVFAFLAPMNVHILNTHIDDEDHAYPGFHSPYAVRLAELDACFGDFIAFLKAQGMYDRSLIVLTSDHGDSLGEGGRWGHQYFLFPEIVRVPMIIRLPVEYQPRVMADLGRIAMLTDLAPTLLGVLGQGALDFGAAGGASLYVPPGAVLRERRRESIMVMSSYGPTYGLLRRNGREMYVVDNEALREWAFSLGPVGYQQSTLGDARRRVNQAGLIAEIEAVERLYRRD